MVITIFLFCIFAILITVIVVFSNPNNYLIEKVCNILSVISIIIYLAACCNFLYCINDEKTFCEVLILFFN